MEPEVYPIYGFSYNNEDNTSEYGLAFIFIAIFIFIVVFIMSMGILL